VRDAQWIAKAGAYLARATRLQCPVCGRTPIFPRAWTVRRAMDWFVPFDGCPRCGYAFEREPGYFLMAVWTLNAGFASLLGMGVYFMLAAVAELGWEVAAPVALGTVVASNLLLVRHAKAYYIAVDHLLDPHDRGGGDDRGNQPLDPDIDPTEPCETATPVR
jgi:hypothetical protein